VLLSYIDENITLSLEAVLMKKSPCKWKWVLIKSHRINGSGIAKKFTVEEEADLMKNRSIN